MWVVLVIYSGVSIYAAYYCMAPFFPSLLEEKGLDPLWNSYVFAAYAISLVLTSISVQTFIFPKLGRVLSFTIGAIIQASVILLFGFLKFVNYPYLFVFLAIFLRLCQGFSTSLVLISSFALLSRYYSS